MYQLTGLSDFSDACIQVFLTRFPQFENFMKPSNFFDGCWSSEIDWPNQRQDRRLVASTWINETYSKQEFRVDFGSWHEHFADWENSGTLDFVYDGVNIIDEILREELVLVEKGSLQEVWVIGVEAQDYDTDIQGWEKGTEKVVKSSWNGTFDREWLRSIKGKEG